MNLCDWMAEQGQREVVQGKMVLRATMIRSDGEP